MLGLVKRVKAGSVFYRERNIGGYDGEGNMYIKRTGGAGLRVCLKLRNVERLICFLVLLYTYRIWILNGISKTAKRYIVYRKLPIILKNEHSFERVLIF